MLMNNILEKQISFKKEIESEIKPTIKHLSNSTYFSERVDEILNHLSIIKSPKIKNQTNESKSFKNLNFIERYYTVKTERLIHEAVRNNDAVDLNNINSNNDSNIELF